MGLRMHPILLLCSFLFLPCYWAHAKPRFEEAACDQVTEDEKENDHKVGDDCMK